MKVSSEVNVAPGPRERYFVVRKKTRQSNIDEMFAKLARNGPVILQGYIKGIGLGAACIFNRYGELISYFGHKRILEAFVDEGPSLIAETYFHPRALKYGADLLRALDWKGPAMVEFRMTPTGRLFFMELNPRFWGTLSLATVSGLDFPKLLLQNYNVRPSNPHFRYKRKTWLRLETLDLLSDSLRTRNYRLAKKVLSSTFKSLEYGPPTIAACQEVDLATITRGLVARIARAMDKNRVSHIGNIMFGPALSNERLSKLGVRHVVDLREDQEKSNDNPPSEDCRLQFHELPLTDDMAPDIETFTSAISLIDDLLKEGKVYIHCRLGTGRAPTIVVGWLLSRGFSLDEAFALLYRMRPYSSLNMVQKKSLYLLYKHFRDDARSGRATPNTECGISVRRARHNAKRVVR
jgi:protein-tyrosine phosphatase